MKNACVYVPLYCLCSKIISQIACRRVHRRCRGRCRISTPIDVDVDKNVKYNTRNTTSKGAIERKNLYLTGGCIGDLQNTVTALLQHIVHCGAVCGKGQSCYGHYLPSESHESTHKEGAVNTRQTRLIKQKFENFLQSLPQADNRFSDAARPHSATVH